MELDSSSSLLGQKNGSVDKEPPSLTTQIQYLGPTQWKDRTSSYKLSSDLHMHTVSHAFAHTQDK